MSATVIGAHARVLGSIAITAAADQAGSGDLIVEGHVEGALSASGVIHLLATAEVRGDLDAARVVIDDGAIFEGQVRLHRAAATAPMQARSPAQRPVAAPALGRREVPELCTPGRQRVQRRSS